MGETVLSVQYHPEDKGQQGDAHNRRHKYAGYLVDQFLYRSLASLGILNGTDNVCQHRVGTYLFGTEAEASFLVDGTGIDLVGFFLPHRNRLPAQHAFIDVRTSLAHLAVYRNALARLHFQDIARHHLSDIHHLHRTVGIHTGHGAGLQSHQFLDGIGGLPFGTFLQGAS